MKRFIVQNGVKLNRIKQGKFSQNELAEYIGVTRQTMNLIENQKYNPSITICLKISKKLNVSLDTLFWIKEE